MGIINYKITDGCKPKKNAGSLQLGAPMGITLGPDEQQELKLGVKLNVPCIVLENPFMRKSGLKLDNAGTMFLADTEITVQIKNIDSGTFTMDYGQTVCFVLPLESNFSIEESE